MKLCQSVPPSGTRSSIGLRDGFGLLRFSTFATVSARCGPYRPDAGQPTSVVGHQRAFLLRRSFWSQAAPLSRDRRLPAATLEPSEPSYSWRTTVRRRLTDLSSAYDSLPLRRASFWTPSSESAQSRATPIILA